mmetsp:Transcript_15605/g.44403  ORF Transcript_15605/g.44403 Transcript_15605/m.44403 type:complete len:209 (-) Transcript_15605:322-948(-)
MESAFIDRAPHDENVVGGDAAVDILLAVQSAQTAQHVASDLDAVLEAHLPPALVQHLLPEGAIHGLLHHEDLDVPALAGDRSPNIHHLNHGPRTELLHLLDMADEVLRLRRVTRHNVEHCDADLEVAILGPGLALQHLAVFVHAHHLRVLEHLEPTLGPNRRQIPEGVVLRRHARSGLAHASRQAIGSIPAPMQRRRVAHADCRKLRG